ncbi:MAG: CrcB family protein, partial [Nitrospinae bacterium]|nr:CrcB family protein [Nitrospinota bacterium]
TLAVNLVGCFLIGLVMELTETRFLIAPPVKIFLTVGFLGGFTTFSTFSFETLALLREGESGLALLNAAGSLALGLVGVWGGMVAGRGI